jgi:hypothetical protein
MHTYMHVDGSCTHPDSRTSFGVGAIRSRHSIEQGYQSCCTVAPPRRQRRPWCCLILQPPRSQRQVILIASRLVALSMFHVHVGECMHFSTFCTTELSPGNIFYIKRKARSLTNACALAGARLCSRNTRQIAWHILHVTKAHTHEHACFWQTGCHTVNCCDWAYYDTCTRCKTGDKGVGGKRVGETLLVPPRERVPPLDEGVCRTCSPSSLDLFLASKKK